MPCTNGGYSPGEPSIEKLDRMTQIACTLLALVKREGIVLPVDIQQWAEEHERADRQRVLREDVQKQRRRRDMEERIAELESELRKL